MLLILFLLACSEYDVANIQDPNSEAQNPALLDTAGDWSSEDMISDEEIAIEEIYVNTGNELYSFVPDTSALTLIGEFKVGQQKIENITDIAINHNGQMFGITIDSLYQIIPRTAEMSFIRSLSKEYMGLTFLGDNNLIAAGSSLDIISIYNDDVNVIIPEGIFETSGDIVGLPDNLIYWTVRGDNEDQLISVNLSGAIEKWSKVENTSGIYGIGYANDELYGFTKDNTVIIIDPLNANVKDEKELNGSWWGAATNPLLWE